MSGPNDGWEDVTDPKEAQAALEGGAANGPTTLTGPALLKTLDPADANLVKAMAEGRQGIPSGYSARSPYMQRLLSLTAQYDPTFDAANLPSRVATRKAFTSQKQAQNITSLNTALGHALSYAENAEKIGNFGGVPLVNNALNRAKNFYESESGEGDISRIKLDQQALADEAARAFLGSAGGVHDRESWMAKLDPSQSPEQLRSSVAELSKLFASRIAALKDSYNTGMGTTDQAVPGLNPHAEEALSHLQSDNYLNNGYQAIAAGGGSNSGGSPPGGGVSDPPLVPTLNGGASLTDADRQKAAEAQALFNDPKSTRADFDALAAKYGGQAYGAELDNALALRARGLGSRVNFNPTPSGEPSAAQGIAQTVLNTVIPGGVDSDELAAAAVGGSNTVTFGALPKITAGINAVGGRLAGDNRSIGDIYSDELGQANDKVEGLASAHPLATLAGETAGFLTGDSLLGKVPGVAKAAARIPGILRPVAGDALYGAATGLGSSDSLDEIPGNVTKGAALSAGGGLLGRGIVKGAGGILSPAVDAGVKRLTDAGVTLTPGQVLGANGSFVGRAVKGIEDRLQGFPVVGDIINGTRRVGTEDFNRAAINDALAPIGQKANGVGHAGIADMQQKASTAINDALAPINAAPDAMLQSDVQAATAGANKLSKAHAEQFNNVIQTDVEPYLRGQSIAGDDIKSIKEGLDARIGNLRGQGSSPQDRDLADALDDVKESFLDFADRADPTASSDYKRARQAYALTKRVEAAAAKGKDGVFTPNQFRTAVTKRGYGTTTANVARGEAPMQQLSTDASTILPSSIPDSGAAGRAALGLLGGGAFLGGGEGYREGGLSGAVPGALLGAAAFSRPGARAIQYALAGSRGNKLNTLGALLRSNAALGGAVGSPLLLSPVLHNGN